MTAAPDRSPANRDAWFLVLVTVASLALYLGALGLYSDDWAHLELMVNAPEHTFFGMLRNFYNEGWAISSRPLQALYLTLLYYLFGLNPTAFHVVNAIVFVLVIAGFHRSLVELRVPRLLAVLPPLVYALLPHYSTMRFWFAAFQGNFSMLLLFASLIAGLRMVRAETRGRVLAWGAAALLSLVLSTLAYEVAAPFFLCIAALIWRANRGPDGRIPKGSLIVFSTAYLGALLLVGMIKATSTVRGPSSGYLHQLLAFDFAGNIRNGVAIHFGTYGIGLPRVAMDMLNDFPNPSVTLASGLLFLVILAYLHHLSAGADAIISATRLWIKTIFAGLLLCALGFAVFVGFSAIPFATTGITNRLAIAATVGTAFVFVGAIGYVASLFPNTGSRRAVFCTALALVCSSGFAVINTEATFWSAAYVRERAVLADIRSHFPTIAHGSTLLLDGVCPYEGSAIVFDSAWDLSSALQIAYRDESIDADVVKPAMVVGKSILQTWSVGERTDRLYGNKLFVYDFASKQVFPMRDEAAASAYLGTPHKQCPAGLEGFGVKVIGVIRNRNVVPVGNLAQSIAKGDAVSIKALLDSGIDPNALLADGKLPLFDAAWVGRKDVVAALVQGGANPNGSAGAGSTAMIAATTQGHLDIVEYLASHGGRVNETSLDGSTPLMIAAWKGDRPLVVLLLSHGADVGIQRADGFDAIGLARAANKPEIVQLLAHSATTAN
jgi:hypothetical protein